MTSIFVMSVITLVQGNTATTAVRSDLMVLESAKRPTCSRFCKQSHLSSECPNNEKRGSSSNQPTKMSTPRASSTKIAQELDRMTPAPRKHTPRWANISGAADTHDEEAMPKDGDPCANVTMRRQPGACVPQRV